MTKKRITHVSVLITEDCNFRCDYCFIKRNPESMEWATMKQLIDWMNKENHPTDNELHIQFFGGEPMLKWSLITKAIEYAKKKECKFRFGITTNGSLFNDERIEYFKKNNVGVLFSIDGDKIAQNTHRKLEDGSGTWDLVEENARKCVEAGIAPTARMTYTPDTLPHLAKSVKYLRNDIGFDTVAPTPAIDSYHHFSDEDLKEWDKQYEEINDLFVENILNGNRPGMNYFSKCFRQMLNDSKLNAPCGAGKRFAGVNWKGELFPCHRFVQWDEWKFGDIWNGITKPKVRKITGEYSLEMNSPKCAKCTNGFCGGTCLAANYENNGNVNMPSEDGCKLSMKQWENAKKLHDLVGDHENFKKFYGSLKRPDTVRKTPKDKKQIENPKTTLRNKKQRPETVENRLKKLENIAVKQSQILLDIAESLNDDE